MACGSCGGSGNGCGTNCNGCCQDLSLKEKNCNDLTSYNNEEIKPLSCFAETIDPCTHLKGFLSTAFYKIWCMLANIIRNICRIEDILINEEGYVTVTKVYHYTVPKEKFIPTNSDHPHWTQWSGSPEMAESFIQIPVKEMDLVDGIVGQPMVVGLRVQPQTIAIQTAEKKGDVYEVNFDCYELNPADEKPWIPQLMPYDLPIMFIVVGRKKVTRIGLTKTSTRDIG